MPNQLDEARIRWGNVFSAFRSARELTNAAKYQVEDRQALKDEDVQRLQALIKNAQNALAEWESEA